MHGDHATDDVSVREQARTAAIAAVSHLLEDSGRRLSGEALSEGTHLEGMAIRKLFEVLRLNVNEYFRSYRPASDTGDDLRLMPIPSLSEDIVWTGFHALREICDRILGRTQAEESRYQHALEGWFDDVGRVGGYEDEDGVLMFPDGVAEPPMPDEPRLALTAEEWESLKNGAILIGARPEDLPRRVFAAESRWITGTRSKLNRGFGKRATYPRYLERQCKRGVIDFKDRDVDSGLFAIRFRDPGGEEERKFRERFDNLRD